MAEILHKLTLQEASPGRTVLIAMDGSKHSNYAFEWYMKNLYKETDNVVIAFCAEYASDLKQTTAALGSPEVIRSMLEKHESRVKRVFDIIDEIVGKHKINSTTERLCDPPGESIINAAYERKADMIVCGSRGHGTLRRTILGSVSDYIIHHSDIPVTVCKQ